MNSISEIKASLDKCYSEMFVIKSNFVEVAKAMKELEEFKCSYTQLVSKAFPLSLEQTLDEKVPTNLQDDNFVEYIKKTLTKKSGIDRLNGIQLMLNELRKFKINLEGKLQKIDERLKLSEETAETQVVRKKKKDISDSIGVCNSRMDMLVEKFYQYRRQLFLKLAVIQENFHKVCTITPEHGDSMLKYNIFNILDDFERMDLEISNNRKIR